MQPLGEDQNEVKNEGKEVTSADVAVKEEKKVDEAVTSEVSFVIYYDLKSFKVEKCRKNISCKTVWYRPIGVVLKDIAIGAGDCEFDSRTGLNGHRGQRLSAATTFLVLPRRYAAEMGPSKHYMFRRITASIMKIRFFI